MNESFLIDSSWPQKEEGLRGTNKKTCLILAYEQKTLIGQPRYHRNLRGR